MQSVGVKQGVAVPLHVPVAQVESIEHRL